MHSSLEKWASQSRTTKLDVPWRKTNKQNWVSQTEMYLFFHLTFKYVGSYYIFVVSYNGAWWEGEMQRETEHLRLPRRPSQ